MTLTSGLARLQVGNTVAAVLGQLVLERDNSTLNSDLSIVKARVIMMDGFWCTQRPTALWVKMGARHWWVWEQVAVTSPLGLGQAVGLEVRGTPQVETE